MRKILVALAALAVAVPLSVVAASPAGANSPGWSDRCIYMPDWYATVCVNAYTASYGTGVHVTQVQVCAFHNNDPGDHLRGTYNMAFETNNGGTALNGDAPGGGCTATNWTSGKISAGSCWLASGTLNIAYYTDHDFRFSTVFNTDASCGTTVG